MRLCSRYFLLGAALVVTPFHTAHAFSGADAYVKQPSGVVFVSDHKAKGAEDFVNKMASDAISFLGDASLSEEQKQKEFSKLLNRSFDMKTIGRFALGRYWRTASAEQRKEYQELFRKMIVEVYSRRFGEYDGQNLEIRGSKADSDKDITVESFIMSPSNNQKIRVDWRIRNKDGQYKVIDVMVEGVSMALTQRSDFSSVIQRGGGQVSVLLEHLRK